MEFDGIGNSLSFCISDIIAGKVKEEDVKKIRCSFRQPLLEDFINQTLRLYCDVYWRKNPELGKEIALRMWHQGKLTFTGGHYLKENWGENGISSNSTF